MFRLFGRCRILVLQLFNNMKNEKKLIDGLKEAVERDKGSDISPWQLPLFPIRSRRGFQLSLNDMEKTIGEDMCVPDESWTINELLRKHASGIAPDVLRTPLYNSRDMTHEDPDLQEVARMDPMDREDFRREVVSKVEDLNADLKKSRKYKADAKAAAKLEAKQGGVESAPAKPAQQGSEASEASKAKPGSDATPA